MVHDFTVISMQLMDKITNQFIQLGKEIARLAEIGILENDYISEWASPTFAIPKKIRIRSYISDYRSLMLKRCILPISMTGDTV
jgi:hypothetical protein